MSKTTIIIATVTNKETQTKGEFSKVKITLENELQKDVVDCYPSKADKINVGDFVKATCESRYGIYQDKPWHIMQVSTIEVIKLDKVTQETTQPNKELKSDDITF